MKKIISLIICGLISANSISHCSAFALEGNDLNCNEVINVLNEGIVLIEEELSKKGTTVENEINKFIKQLEYKYRQVDSPETKEQMETLINTAISQKREFLAYKQNNGVLTRGVYHPVYSAAVSAVIAYFGTMGYLLSAEFLMFAVQNDNPNTVYRRPSWIDRMRNNPVVNRIRVLNIPSGSDTFEANNTVVEMDLYYAIHKFSYINNNRSITIIDTYDFEFTCRYDGLAGTAISMMYYAQTWGVIVPFDIEVQV